ncbi:MAG: hypothetical protein AAF629_35865, partial [Chloroflexota bacterium]
MIRFMRAWLVQKRSLLILATLGLLTLFLWPSLVAAVPLTTQNQFDRVWKLAQDIGRYEFSTNVAQTVHPTLHVKNIGRSPSTTHMTADGLVDMPGEIMEFNLRTQDGPREGIQIRMADGKAFGRATSQAEWTELEDSGASFAPGNDLMAFAVAAENVRLVPDGNMAKLDGLTLARTANATTHYAFDINSVKYAQYLRKQMAHELARKGELPPGAQLSLADQFVDMEAHGELWVNADGLPVYQVITMKLAAEPGAMDRVEAEIATTFSGWDQDLVQNRLFWMLPRIIDNPAILTEDPASLLPNIHTLTPRDLEAFGLMLGWSLLLTAFLLLLFKHRHSPRLQAAVGLSIILSMVITPLLQASQLHAFSARQATRQADYEVNQAQAEANDVLKNELAQNNFNPNRNPLAADEMPLTMAELSEARQSISSNYIETAPPKTAPAIAGAIPMLQTCLITTTDDDCDGDGLTNGAELSKLGTDPAEIDTDGDRISDGAEVSGFFVNGRQWYLNPLDPDSNGDSYPDGVECPARVDVGIDGNFITVGGNVIDVSGNACENFDSDGTPDIFDFDNDGDGVPDTVDGSPNYRGDLSTALQDEIDVELSGYEAGQTLLVEFQLRPEDAEQLWQTGNYMNWPSNDPTGHIARMRSNSLPGSNGEGDLRIAPLLEITIPAPSDNGNNLVGSLPITPGLTFAEVSATDPLTAWLDTDFMDEYGISVSQNQETGVINAYVPLSIIQDSVGDTPVAWGGRMPYRPDAGAVDWGTEHKARLVWSITGLTDYCDTTGRPTEAFQKFVGGQWVTYSTDEELYDYWCSQPGNWRTNPTPKVIQTYIEPFKLTGLSVTEHQGAKHAIAAQRDALTDNVAYEDDLWQLANGLQQSFSPGKSFVNTSGVEARFDIEEIKNRFDNG